MARQQLSSPFESFVAGRSARLAHDYQANRNALADMEVAAAPEQMRQQNALADVQMQSAQAGLQGQQQQLNANQAKFAYAMLKQAQDSGNPKAFIMQQIPDLASNLQQRGIDINSMDDQSVAQLTEQLARKYAGEAGIAPTPKLETLQGDGGSILQRDPTTGALKQVVAPQKPDRFAETQAAADRRAAEARAHAERMAAEQREFTANQNQLNRDAKNKPITQNPEATIQKLDSANNTLSAIRDVKEKIGLMTAGPGGQLMRAFAGTDAADMEANIDTIKANIGFDRLQMMRDASKTGGALGGIAVQELNLLQSTIASLNQKQSPSQLKTNLGKVESQYQKAVNAYERALGLPQTDWSKEGAPANPQTPRSGQPMQVRSIQEAMALPPGTVFITPDGRRKVR